MKLLVLASLLSMLAACDEFATPADLDRPQILAIRSVPASVGVGESATLSIIVAGENGPILTPVVFWAVVAEPGSPALGSISTDGEQIVYTAPSNLEQSPSITTVEAVVDLGDASLTGVKAMLIDGPTLSNPVLAEVLVDDLRVSDTIVVTAGSEVELAIPTEGFSDEATFSWYARPGTIQEYRSATTRYFAPDAPGDGWIFIVVRDRGGVSYRPLSLEVE